MVSMLSFWRNLDLKGNRGAGIGGVGPCSGLGDISGDATGLLPCASEQTAGKWCWQMVSVVPCGPPPACCAALSGEQGADGCSAGLLV